MSNVTSLDEYRRKKKIAVLFDRHDPSSMAMAKFVEINEPPVLTRERLEAHIRKLLKALP